MANPKMIKAKNRFLKNKNGLSAEEYSAKRGALMNYSRACIRSNNINP